MPFHTKAKRKKSLKKLKKLKIGLKKDFIAFNKTPTIGQKIGVTRKKLSKKLSKPKFKKIRKRFGERGRFIGESLGRPVDFNI
ncbi:hypothetical protein LCGC14_2313280 [marine sediment metagenome]|uniref:Uncharacterized protein n=1 Tax=marine sediment metagenome TaxID=412755 RepID=A0A0F9CKJ2_9ZZZZ